MLKRMNVFGYIAKSKFVRSVFLRVLAIILIASIAIIAIVFSSFTSQIQTSIIADRQNQLAMIESPYPSA